MSTGEPINLGLQNQLQAVLDQLGKEETKRLAVRVKAEEKICLDQKQSAHHAREVRAWEGTKIFIREKSGGREQKVHCDRVGRAFLRIQSEGGGESTKIKRSSLSSIRTPEERLLSILDDKIDNASKHGLRRLEATSARLEKLHGKYVKDCAEFNKEMDSLASFRSRVHAVLVRKGLILNPPNRKGDM